MSKKGRCADNAAMEGFFGRLWEFRGVGTVVCDTIYGRRARLRLAM